MVNKFMHVRGGQVIRDGSTGYDAVSRFFLPYYFRLTHSAIDSEWITLFPEKHCRVLERELN